MRCLSIKKALTPRRRPPPNSFPAFSVFPPLRKNRNLKFSRTSRRSPSGRKAALAASPPAPLRISSRPCACILFSDFSLTLREAGIATSLAGKRSAAIHPTAFPRRSASTTKIIPAGSPCPAKRRKNEPAHGHLQAIRRSGFRHHRLRRGRRRPCERTLHQRFSRGCPRTRRISPRKRFHTRRNQNLRPKPAHQQGQRPSRHFPKDARGNRQETAGRSLWQLLGRQQRSLHRQLLAFPRNRFQGTQQGRRYSRLHLCRLTDFLCRP